MKDIIANITFLYLLLLFSWLAIQPRCLDYVLLPMVWAVRLFRQTSRNASPEPRAAECAALAHHQPASQEPTTCKATLKLSFTSAREASDYARKYFTAYRVDGCSHCDNWHVTEAL